MVCAICCRGGTTVRHDCPIPTSRRSSNVRAGACFNQWKLPDGSRASGQGQDAHWPDQPDDLHIERFLKNEAGDGPIKAFTLRGIKDSPPYFHDGRLLTLEDSVEFFNLVLELKLTPEEKHNLVEFMRQL